MYENSNSTGNGTDTNLSDSSSAGLAIGLSIFFIFLIITACGVVFMYRERIWTFLVAGKRENHEKEVCAESAQDDQNQYTSMMQQCSEAKAPIYENLERRAAGSKVPEAKQRSPPLQPEEDVYVECEPEDEGIYSNDPAFNSKLPDDQEEDTYLMPEC